MNNKYVYGLLLVLLCFLAMPFSTASAATFDGEFVEAVYQDVLDDKQNVIGEELHKIILRKNGHEREFFMNDLANMYINNTQTTIAGFKPGMPVIAKITLARVTELRGTSVDNSGETHEFEEGNTSTEGQIPANSRSVSGIVTEIDPYGMFVTVKPDNKQETQYYLNRDTQYFKANNQTTLAGLFVGDRVQIRLSSSTSSTVSQLRMSDEGKKVAGIYKGTLQLFASTTNRMTIRGEQQFANWDFQATNARKLKAYKTTSRTTYYVGGMKVSKNQLRNYRGSDVYYVTTNMFGQETVEKVIVLSMRERTYTGIIEQVSTAYKYMRLNTLNYLYYHDGSILVRNGRLIEPTSLVAQGQAFAVTQPQGNTEVANMIYMTTNGFTSASLADHDVYYAALDWVDGYGVELYDVLKLDSNNWRYIGTELEDGFLPLAYTNTTAAHENANGTNLNVDVETELELYLGEYAYFYVQDGVIEAIYFPDSTEAGIVMTGNVSNVKANQPTELTIQSASEWVNGNWETVDATLSLNTDTALIVKDGRVVTMRDIAKNDHVYVLTNMNGEAQLIFVN
ncbi:hypothetical protein [Caryophanon tenue]|uniref:S1 motif domain-containing protein n=1 Tax=Caryophanon tenue TaxID=33978 RepID=A0A1C0YML8_9BACL|nr:hypothetical protein [Caryophanon tenue]OCS88427.1 hypothetical protein A6M13_00855 [Caryophanon tenue]